MSSDSYQHYERIMKKMKRSKRGISTGDRAFIELYKDLEKTETSNKILSSIVDHQKEIIDAMKLNGCLHLKDMVGENPTEGKVLSYISKLFVLTEQHDCIVEKIFMGVEDFDFLQKYAGSGLDKCKDGRIKLWTAEIIVCPKVEPGIKFISNLTKEHEEIIKSEGKSV